MSDPNEAYRPLPAARLGPLDHQNRPFGFEALPDGKATTVGFVFFDESAVALALGEIDEFDAAEEARELSGRFAIGLVKALLGDRDGRGISTRVVGLAYVLGLVDDATMDALSARLGVCKQALGKQVSAWRDTLAPLAKTLKSQRARQAYRESARAVHRRRKEGLLG